MSERGRARRTGEDERGVDRLAGAASVRQSIRRRTPRLYAPSSRASRIATYLCRPVSMPHVKPEASPGPTLVFALFEAALLGAIALALAASVTGHASLLASVHPALRAVAALVAATFAVAPLWVFYDVYRADDDYAWVHVVVLPLVNLIGLAAYLHHRRQRAAE